MSDRDPESIEHAAIMRRVDDLKDHKPPLGELARTIITLQGALDLLWLNKAHFGIGCYCRYEGAVRVHTCIEHATRESVAPFVTENWSPE